MAREITVEGHTPDLSAAGFVAPDVVVAGRVTVGEESTLWYGVVVRAEYEDVVIGARSNLQDGTVVHCDPGAPVTIGDDVTIGHRAVVHGCTIEDGALVGMGAVVLNGAVIGARSLVAAGAVVRENMVVPPDSLVAGVPAKVVKELGTDRPTYPNVPGYVHLGRLYAEADPGEDAG